MQTNVADVGQGPEVLNIREELCRGRFSSLLAWHGLQVKQRRRTSRPAAAANCQSLTSSSEA